MINFEDIQPTRVETELVPAKNEAGSNSGALMGLVVVGVALASVMAMRPKKKKRGFIARLFNR